MIKGVEVLFFFWISSRYSSIFFLEFTPMYLSGTQEPQLDQVFRPICDGHVPSTDRVPLRPKPVVR